MAVDPDVQAMIDPIHSRLDALESGAAATDLDALATLVADRLTVMTKVAPAPTPAPATGGISLPEIDQ